jgi:hypothetical protein
MAVRRFRENKWIADVFRDGQRFRKVFDTKRHALAWDGKIKTAALEGRLFDVKQDTFATFEDRNPCPRPPPNAARPSPRPAPMARPNFLR